MRRDSLGFPAEAAAGATAEDDATEDEDDEDDEPADSSVLETGEPNAAADRFTTAPDGGGLLICTR